MSVSARTIENWEREDRLPLDEPKRALLATIAEIRELGLSVYTAAGFTRFLTTPLQVFDNHTALKEIELGHADRVLGQLAADYEGGGH
jgi:transcriptional regulator with XRE-family HTH domain